MCNLIRGRKGSLIRARIDPSAKKYIGGKMEKLEQMLIVLMSSGVIWPPNTPGTPEPVHSRNGTAPVNKSNDTSDASATSASKISPSNKSNTDHRLHHVGLGVPESLHRVEHVHHVVMMHHLHYHGASAESATTSATVSSRKRVLLASYIKKGVLVTHLGEGSLQYTFNAGGLLYWRCLEGTPIKKEYLCH